MTAKKKSSIKQSKKTRPRATKPKPYKYRARIEAIFKGYEFYNYREFLPSKGEKLKAFVEFTVVSETEKVGTYVSLDALLAVSRLLDTDDISMTGFDVGTRDMCETCTTSTPVVYVVATLLKDGE